MNIIEQLGGYEIAKKFINGECADGFDVQSLRDALLEYRRQNNIFEVGDFVLRKDGFSNVLKITDVDGEYADLVRSVDGEPRWSRFKLVEIQHATDAEIAAGKRL